MLPSRHLFAYLLAATMLLGGWVTSTHTHVHEAGQTCSHAAHANSHQGCESDCDDQGTPDSPKESECPTGDHHDDDCQLCKIIAEFVATPLASTSLIFDSAVTTTRVESASSTSYESPLGIRGRAPPTSCC